MKNFLRPQWSVYSRSTLKWSVRQHCITVAYSWKLFESCQYPNGAGEQDLPCFSSCWYTYFTNSRSQPTRRSSVFGNGPVTWASMPNTVVNLWPSNHGQCRAILLKTLGLPSGRCARKNFGENVLNWWFLDPDHSLEPSTATRYQS